MEINRFLVESALLTHGLSSISNDELIKRWKFTEKNIVWVDKGEIVIGDIKEFCEFRKRAEELIRIDCFTLEDSLDKKLSGALTASGTMKVCENMGIELAITCGMGGIGDIKDELLCPDLPALRDIKTSLISTSPKDMLDIKGTLAWLKDNGVRVVGSGTRHCTGYIFNSVNIEVDGSLEDFEIDLSKAKLLILNPIPADKKAEDLSIVDEAIKAGKHAEEIGEYYHPAANKKIDELTKGYSSWIQLDSLIENVKLAQKITDK